MAASLLRAYPSAIRAGSPIGQAPGWRALWYHLAMAESLTDQEFHVKGRCSPRIAERDLGIWPTARASKSSCRAACSTSCSRSPPKPGSSSAPTPRSARSGCRRSSAATSSRGRRPARLPARRRAPLDAHRAADPHPPRAVAPGVHRSWPDAGNRAWTECYNAAGISTSGRQSHARVRHLLSDWRVRWPAAPRAAAEDEEAKQAAGQRSRPRRRAAGSGEADVAKGMQQFAKSMEQMQQSPDGKA